MVNEYITRRTKLIEKLPNNSISIIFGGSEIRKSADEAFKFQIDYNLYYLTGVKQAETILVFIKKENVAKTLLFIQKFDELKEKWTGIRLKEDEAREISGIKEILFSEDFSKELKNIVKEFDKVSFGLDYESAANYGNFDKFISVCEYKDILSKEFANVDFFNIGDELKLLRMVKSDYEIEELRKAIHNTNRGLIEILKKLEPNKYEYEMAALFKYIISLDNSKLSFNTIAASGKNATILHYPDPIDKMKDGDLLLLDLGSDHNEYKADISRTYPINGKFSEMQRKIYEIVLNCNKHIIEIIKPGLTIKVLQEETKRFMADKLIELNLINNPDEIIKYYYHNVSHHLGLDTHDISLRELPLVKGNVITVEPGLYIKELGIGIRIEDDVLVTEDGSECLSKEIIKEINDIESIMK
ncbi:MAG: aminopeptidase P N-terminal domain-containing protein [Erysipelotrichales bacterium]|nr:aminopeptidase P N-terminal domain-containing protein [Erysipelotrichales bacterium]